MSQPDDILIHRHLDGVATHEGVAELSTRLETDPLTRMLYLELAQIHGILAAEEWDDSPSPLEPRFIEIIQKLEGVHRRRQLLRMSAATIAVSALIALAAVVYVARQASISQVARVTDVEGSVRWTNANGQVIEPLEAGHALTGGNLEALSPDSLVRIEFNDKSVITLSGTTRLVILESDKKDLRLNKGSLSARIVPQPENKPFFLRTTAAEYEVKGTQFDVTANELSSSLAVAEGVVFARRTTDGKLIEVRADQSTIATIEAEEPFEATTIPQPVYTWKAELARDRGEGSWVSAAQTLRLEFGEAVRAGRMTREEIRRRYSERLANLPENGGVLSAAPMKIGGKITYTVSVDVARRGGPRVILLQNHRIRIQGQVRIPTELKIGFTTVDRSTVSRWRYSKAYLSDVVAEEFDIALPIEQFSKGQVADRSLPIGQQLLNIFCMTGSREAALQITDVQLLPPQD